MPIRSAFAAPLLICLSAEMAPCQTVDGFLARMDRFSPTFTGAKATIRSTVHGRGMPDDDVETGTILVKRSGGKTQFRIDFKEPNIYSAAMHDQVAEVYHPKLNEIDVYDLSAYKDVAEKLFLLGFGMPGRELADNYEIGNPKP